MSNSPDCIGVVDFGGQYAHLIARRVRELHVFSEIVSQSSPVSKFRCFKGIILSGGPASVYEKGSPQIDKAVLGLGIPVLGICYGHQLIAHLLGGKVEGGAAKEYGAAGIEVKGDSALFSLLGKKLDVWMSHGDYVSKLPSGFKVIASTPDCVVAGMSDEKRRIFGIQFHPEVVHTPKGMGVLSNFVHGVCNCGESWNMENFSRQKILELKKKVGGKNVFMLVSGGVDSTVALRLLEEAIGSERIFALHIDSGFMRLNESSLVISVFRDCGLKVHLLDVAERFFSALKGVCDPEEKRRIIGDLFAAIANEKLKELSSRGEWLLGQGTIYPDTIESAGTKHSSKIKTHHNRVESIKQMIEEGLVVEPIAELYKDEVRELGKSLGISKDLLWRHPFPGPGLAIRVLCSENDFFHSDLEFERNLSKAGKEHGFSAHVLPVKSVGVQGDSRSYRHAVVIEGKLDWALLEKASTAITNRFSGVNRVVYLAAPSKSMEFNLNRASFLSRERVSLLREVDDFVSTKIMEAGFHDKIWQFPIVLLPVSMGCKGKESIVLRPVSSKEAMTAEFFRLEPDFLVVLAEEIMKRFPISAVFYDVTHKPPATIEWE